MLRSMSSQEAGMDISSCKHFAMPRSVSRRSSTMQEGGEEEEEEEESRLRAMRAAEYRSLYLRSYKLSRKETVRERVKRSLSRLKSLACTFLACQYHFSVPCTTSTTRPLFT